MSTLETGLRELIAGIVRDEVRRALADSRPDADPYLSTAEAGVFAGVAAGTIRRWIREGRIQERRAGRVVRVRRADLEHLLVAGRRAVATATPEELAARDFGR